MYAFLTFFGDGAGGGRGAEGSAKFIPGASTVPGGMGGGRAAAGGGSSGPRMHRALSEASWWTELEAGGDRRKEALRAKMVEVLGMPQLSERRRVFGALLEYYQPGDLESIHGGMIAREKMGGRYNTEYEMMMERAAEVEGMVVMDEITAQSGGPGRKVHGWQERCVANFAAANPAAAAEWWNNLPEGTLRDRVSRSLVEGMGRVDVERAWRAAQMFDPAERAQFAPALATQFVEARGGEQAIAWVAGLPAEDSASKVNALRELADYMHYMPQARQAELYAQFAGEPWVAGSGVFEKLATTWGSRGPNLAADATAWAETLPEAIRASTASAAVKVWSAQDAASAGTWLEAHRDSPSFPGMANAFMSQLRKVQSPDLDSWQTRLGVATQPR